MTIAKIRDWLEVVGLFAVVLSLLFVGWEVKQAKDIAIGAEYQVRADTQIAFVANTLENQRLVERFGEFWRPAYIETAQSMTNSDDLLEQFEDFSHYELGLEHLARLQYLFMEQNHYLQYKQGLMSEEDFAATRHGLRNWVASSDWYWLGVEAGRELFHPQFMEVLDDFRREHLESKKLQ